MLSNISVFYVITFMYFVFFKSTSANEIQCYSFNIETVVGENVTLECFLNMTTPSNCTRVGWSKDSKPLIESNYTKISLVSEKKLRYTFSVLFTNVSLSDSGVYTVQYIIGARTDVSNLMHVLVKPKPTKPVCLSSKESYTHGDNVTLQCETFTYNNLKLYWEISPQADPNHVGFKNTSDGNVTTTTLFFAVEQHSGEVSYKCVMEVAIGEFKCKYICHSQIIIVKSKLDVKIRKSENRHQTVLECLVISGEQENFDTLQETHYITANESAKSKASKDGVNIIWSSNNVSVNKSIDENIKTDSLVIQNFTSNKIGETVVTCTVTYADSVSSASIVLSGNSRTATTSLLKSPTDSKPTLVSKNHFAVYSTIAILSAAISIALLSIIRYIKVKFAGRHRNEQLNLGPIQSFIRADESTIHTPPLSPLAFSASANTFRINNPSQQTIFDSVHETSILNSRTGVQWMKHGRSTDSLPSIPEVLKRRSIPHETETDDMNTDEKQVEVLGEPVYDEIKNKSCIVKRSEQFLICDSDGVIVKTRGLKKPNNERNQLPIVGINEMFLDSEYNELFEDKNTEKYPKELQTIHPEEMEEHAGAIDYSESMTIKTTGKSASDVRNPRVVDMDELLSDSQYSELNWKKNTIDNHFNECQKKYSDILVEHTRAISNFDCETMGSKISRNPLDECNHFSTLGLQEALSDPEYNELCESTDNTEENANNYRQKHPRGMAEHPEKNQSTDQKHTINVNRPITSSTDDLTHVKVTVGDVPDGRGLSQVYQLYSVPMQKKHHQEPKVAGSLDTTFKTFEVDKCNKKGMLYSTIIRKYKRETLKIPEENVHVAVAQDLHEDITYIDEIKDLFAEMH